LRQGTVCYQRKLLVSCQETVRYHIELLFISTNGIWDRHFSSSLQLHELIAALSIYALAVTESQGHTYLQISLYTFYVE